MTHIGHRWSPRKRWAVSVAYVVCWAVGLAVGGPDLAPWATSATVSSEFEGSLAILVFAIAVHGIAGLLLVALGWSLAHDTGRRGVIVVALLAGLLSFVQLIGEVALVEGQDVVPASSVWQLVTRVDGAKMLLLVVLIVVVHRGRFRGRVVVSVISGAASLALVLSGIGYLGLIEDLMAAATASLPLLLVWAIAATASRNSKASPARP